MTIKKNAYKSFVSVGIKSTGFECAIFSRRLWSPHSSTILGVTFVASALSFACSGASVCQTKVVVFASLFFFFLESPQIGNDKCSAQRFWCGAPINLKAWALTTEMFTWAELVCQRLCSHSILFLCNHLWGWASGFNTKSGRQICSIEHY